MRTRYLAAIILFISTFQAAASATDCSAQFADGRSPSVTSSAVAQRLTEICFQEYAVLYSGRTRTPLWSAELLTNNRIKEGKKLKRQDKFHEEEAVPYADRSFLKDYQGSGKFEIDRGHMSPNADFDNYQAQFESFSLANIVPQSSNNNQHLWVAIETITRTLATQRQRIFVITGPIFDENPKKLNDRVTIPTRLFKAIYDPIRKEAGAYITENQPGDAFQIVSIHELESQIGFNLFPSMPASIKSKAMPLPYPDASSVHFKNKRSSRYSSAHQNKISGNVGNDPLSRAKTFVKESQSLLYQLFDTKPPGQNSYATQ